MILKDLFSATCHETLAGVFALIAVIFLLLSISGNIRHYALRIFAILLISSLSLFANHWSCYFLVILIIATTVTDLEFLENIAAIIRGSKEYFPYKARMAKVDFSGDKDEDFTTE